MTLYNQVIDAYITLVDMQKSKIHLPSTKLMIMAAGGLLGVIVLWYAVLAILFSAADMREKTLAALSQHLGAEVEAIDEQSFSLMPWPKLILNSVQIKNHPKSRYPSMLRAPTVKIVPSFASILGDLVVAVTFYDPKIEFETFADKTNSWDVSERENKADRDVALLQNIGFVNSEIHYSNSSVGRDILLKNMSFGLQFSSAKDYSAQGRFRLARDIFYFSVNVDGSGGRHFSLNNASSHYQFDGKVEANSGELSGKHKFDSKDLGHLLEVFLKSGNEPPKMVQQNLLPVSFSSDLTMSGKQLKLSDIIISGTDIDGTGKAIATIGAIPEINAQFDLKSFSIDKLLKRGVLDDFIASTGKGANIDGYRIELPEDKNSSLPNGIKMTLSLKSKKAAFSGLDISNLQLAAKMNNSLIDVSNLSGEISDGGKFILKGKVQGSYDGLAFKGEADVAGKKFASVFAHLMQTDKENSFSFPDSFKRFRGHTNLFVNPAVMRLSDGVMRVENMQLMGTLVRQRLDKPNTVGNANLGYRYEGAFRLRNLDLDELWNNNFDVSQAKEAGNGIDRDKLFKWVKMVMQSANNSSFNFKLNFVDYMLGKKKRESSNFRLSLNSHLLGFDEMSIPYNGALVEGSTKISFTDEGKPKVDANLKFDEFDSEKLFGKGFIDKRSMWRDENGLWSRKEFNILGLGETDINLNFQAGKFKHAEYELQNLKGNLLIEDGVLRISGFKGNIWGGNIRANGKMIIGKLPTFTGDISMNGFDFANLHGITDLFSNLYGRGSLRAEFTTTGVNPRSAIYNMKGSISFASGGLKVNGFNLANMVRAANAVRSVDDIEKLVKFANRSGETKITTIQGNMNIDGGYLRTPMMRIVTPVGNGNIKGQINLMDWNANIGISITLAGLGTGIPPNIRLLFIGPFKGLKRSLDTQSLESFIAKQSAERLLVNP